MSKWIPDGMTADTILETGVRVGDIVDKWERLMAIVAIVSPTLYRQCEKGVFDMLTDADIVKVRLIGEIAGM